MKRSGMNRTSMKRSFAACLGALTLTAAIAAGPTDANAVDGRALASGVIGGMSAGAVMGAPYYPAYPSYGQNFYPSYPAPVYYVPPLGPPPGCVIRQQRVWDGYRWRWRKLRICH